MSVKKLLILSATGVAALGATAAYAGGPDFAPAPVPAFEPMVYVEGYLGYADVDWRNFALSPFTAFSDNSRGGFTGGGDIGYQFTPHLGVEFGGYWLPRVRGSFFGIPVRVTSWFLYLAGKLTVPVYDRIDLFGKIGAGWRRLRGISPFGASDNDYWRPIFAGGATYHITHEFTASFQYIRFPARISSFTAAPAANLYLGGVGYQFAV